MGSWDNAPEASGPTTLFVSLKDGDKFVGKVLSVEFITIPAGTMPQQPTDLEDVPLVKYEGTDGQEYEFKYTTAVFRNGILRLKPEVGTWVFHHRIGRNKRGYVDAVIRVARPEELSPGDAAEAKLAEIKAAPVATPKAKPVDDEPDF